MAALIYVVIPSYEFEGYGEPVAAFESKAAAETDALARSDHYVDFEVFELQVQS